MKLGVENTRLIAIGDAIRNKRGTQGLYSLAEMPDAIEGIEAEAVIEQKNISANGTYNAPSGVDGFSPVVVDVPNSYGASDEGKVVDNGALVAQTSRTIDENGTYDTTLNNEVVVDVEGGSATLIPKTITENGTYDPSDDDADGYNEVIVNVAGGGSGDAILKTVKIWTHSTGGQDASLYAQEFTWDGETLTAVGSPIDISFWSFYNHEIEYLDLFDAVRLSYTSPNWAISAITDVIYNGNAISAGNQIAYWHYATNTTCFIICDVEGGEPKNILSGTDAPSASLGSDGDIYLQYIHIPSGVTPLEYIQSTGTQYIDTDVLATSDIAVEVEFFDYVFSGDSLLFGYRPNSWNGGLGVNNNGNSKMYLYYGGENNGGVIPPMESGIVKLENGIRTINGYEAYFTPTTFSYSYQIFIFATNNNGTASYFSKYKIKSLKIWEDGTLIRYFIPAKDTNDVACLYDLINDDFYYNGGAGTFSEGNEINDDYIINSYCKVNGTWQALEGTDIDDVNTEGGGGIPLISKDDWDALSLAEKRTYGLVAIQKAVSGYNRGILVNGADYQLAKIAEMIPIHSWNASNNTLHSYAFAGTTLDNENTMFCMAIMSQNGTNPSWDTTLEPITQGSQGNGNYAICYGGYESGISASTISMGDNWNNSEIVCFEFSGEAEPTIKEVFYEQGSSGTYAYTYTATESENLLLVCMRGGSAGDAYTISGLTQKSHVTSSGGRFNDVYYGSVENGDEVTISIPYASGNNSNGSLLVVLMSVEVEE